MVDPRKGRRRGGLIVRALVSGSSPDRAVRVGALAGELCCVFEQDTFHSASFHEFPPSSMNGYRPIGGEIFAGSDLQWTSIPSRGSRNTPSRFMLQKPE